MMKLHALIWKPFNLMHKRISDFLWDQRLKKFKEFRIPKTGIQWDHLKKEEKGMKNQNINNMKIVVFKHVQDQDRHKIFAFHKLAKFQKDSPVKVLLS